MKFLNICIDLPQITEASFEYWCTVIFGWIEFFFKCFLLYRKNTTQSYGIHPKLYCSTLQRKMYLQLPPSRGKVFSTSELQITKPPCHIVTKSLGQFFWEFFLMCTQFFIFKHSHTSMIQLIDVKGIMHKKTFCCSFNVNFACEHDAEK